MAKNAQFVTHITDRSTDFPQWYTDVIMQADMVDYSSVRGCMVIKPYGYAIWENIQNYLDKRFKETGHENAYFPLFIPESLLQKEVDHVEGFAPEVAWVTHAGNEELTERLCVRPTSETIICSMYAKWLNSYRDLPYLYNQWANVVRWEKTTRPFLRTSEFLWQEGHTLHETHEEAMEEVIRMLDIYVDLAEKMMAIPVIRGEKSEKERFAGAAATYTMEALMHDGKALQMGTSHDLGQHFSKVYDIRFSDRNGELQNPYQTSWGSSTRLIGGLIMVHGDERGLKLPPNIAPIQVVIVPIASNKEGVLEKANEIYNALINKGIKVKLDDRDTVSPGYKFNEWELKGVPLRIEIGPKDIEKGSAVYVRRDNFEKGETPISSLENDIPKLLESIQQNMFDMALKHREEHTVDATDFDTFTKHIESGSGFVRAMWCGEKGCEEEIKEKTGATTRCAPFDQKEISKTCVHCGKPASRMMYFAKAY
ncbi:MAG: proline--tRNA ligase [Clostridia bacterium]|nr:proline--tRNA ligase [Clostridia bacterium]